MIERLRLHVRGAMTVKEFWSRRNKARKAKRFCKKQLTRANRRAWKQSLEQGFDGLIHLVKGGW